MHASTSTCKKQQKKSTLSKVIIIKTSKQKPSMMGEASLEYVAPSKNGFCVVELRDSEDSPARGVGVVSCTIESLKWEAADDGYRCSLDLHMTTINEDGAERVVDEHVDDVPAVLLWRTMPDDGDVEDAARSCLAKTQAQGMHAYVPWVNTKYEMEASFLRDSVEEFQLVAAARKRRCRGPPIIPKLVKMIAAVDKILVDMGVLDLIAPYLKQKDKRNLGAVSRSLRQACIDSREINRIVEALIRRPEGFQNFTKWLNPQRAAVVEELSIDTHAYDPALFLVVLGRLTSVRKLKFTVSDIEYGWRPPAEIWNLRQLEDLFLPGTIDVIPGEISNLQSLTSLGLGMRATSLPPELGLLTSLRRLDLGRCGQIKTLPLELGQLSMLEHLELKECDYLETIEVVTMLTSLTHLCLASGYRLQPLPSDISQLKALKTLDLDSFYKIQALPAEISGLKSLETLRLVNCNKLQSLPPQIGMLKSLNSITLEDNEKFESLPPEIGMLSALTRLNVCNTVIDSLPPEISGLKALKELFLAGLRIEYIPQIGDLTSLEVLDLGECDFLEELPSTIGNLQQLNFLDLNHCSQLKILPEELSKLLALEHLDVTDCRDSVLASVKKRPGLKIINDADVSEEDFEYRDDYYYADDYYY